MNWRDYEIKKLTLSDSNFPAGLKKIKSAPKQIYFRGNLDGVALSKSIAVVGSRQITSYGREVIDKFVSSFVLNKVTTISGFMYGVDTQVHQIAAHRLGRHFDGVLHRPRIGATRQF